MASLTNGWYAWICEKGHSDSTLFIRKIPNPSRLKSSGTPQHSQPQVGQD